MARNNKPFPPDAIVTALDGAAMELPDGSTFGIQRGGKLRGDHPAVLQNPHLFTAGVGDDEIANARAEFLHEHYGRRDEPDPEIVRKSLERRLHDVDSVVLADVRVAGVAPGQKVAKTDPLVKDHPGCWVDVVGKNMIASESLVALATMRHGDANSNIRTVFIGQWVRRDDPLVAIHPHQFGLIRER